MNVFAMLKYCVVIVITDPLACASWRRAHRTTDLDSKRMLIHVHPGKGAKDPPDGSRWLSASDLRRLLRKLRRKKWVVCEHEPMRTCARRREGSRGLR